MFLMGPSLILDLPMEVWLPISSFPLLGLFQVFVFIPIIPEMLERLQVSLEITEGEDEYIDAKLNDKCNDAYGFIYALSMFVSPLIGSWLYDQFGPRKTCDYVALANLGLGAFFLIFNCGIFVFSENRKFNEKLMEIKNRLVQVEEDN